MYDSMLDLQPPTSDSGRIRRICGAAFVTRLNKDSALIITAVNLVRMQTSNVTRLTVRFGSESWARDGKTMTIRATETRRRNNGDIILKSTKSCRETSCSILFDVNLTQYDYRGTREVANFLSFSANFLSQLSAAA